MYNHLTNDDHIIELNPLFNHEYFDMIAKIEVKSEKHLNSYAEKVIQNHEGVLDIKILS